MANLKKYVATFWRSNPQFKAGGYETTRTIEAVSIASARKKAREIYEHMLRSGFPTGTRNSRQGPNPW